MKHTKYMTTIKTHPNSWREDNQYSIQQNQNCQKAEQQEPEPDENINLLIYWKKKVFISVPKYIRFDCCCFKRKQRMLKAWFRAGLTYIKWQYTHSVMLFNFSTCSKLVESTLCHPGENIHLKYWVSFQDFITEFHHHGIYSIFLIPFSKWDHLDTKR